MINLTQQLFDELKAYAKNDEANQKTISPELFALHLVNLFVKFYKKVSRTREAMPCLSLFCKRQILICLNWRLQKLSKHTSTNLPLYSGNKRYEFDRTMALVMGANDDKTNIKDLLPYILSGYFSDSIFF
jgi:hypothetical protein